MAAEEPVGMTGSVGERDLPLVMSKPTRLFEQRSRVLFYSQPYIVICLTCNATVAPDHRAANPSYLFGNQAPPPGHRPARRTPAKATPLPIPAHHTQTYPVSYPRPTHPLIAHAHAGISAERRVVTPRMPRCRVCPAIAAYPVLTDLAVNIRDIARCLPRRNRHERLLETNFTIAASTRSPPAHPLV